MSDQVDKLLKGFERFNVGDFEAAGENLDEHVHWVARLAAVDAPVLRGREEVIRAWREQSAALGQEGKFSFEVLSTEEVGGGCVITELRMHGTGTRSEIEIIDEYTAVWTFRGGKVVRVDPYADRAAALADLAR